MSESLDPIETPHRAGREGVYTPVDEQVFHDLVSPLIPDRGKRERVLKPDADPDALLDILFRQFFPLRA